MTGPTEEDVKSQIRDHLYEQQSLGQYPPKAVFEIMYVYRPPRLNH